jgi:hypothetical protein
MLEPEEKIGTPKKTKAESLQLTTNLTRVLEGARDHEPSWHQ